VIRSRRQAEPFHLTLRLRRPEDLFVKPDLTPLSPDYQDHSYTSGLEFIYGELYAAREVRPVSATIELPPEHLEPDLEARLTAAIERYCRGRMLEIGHEISALRWRGLRELAFGFVALILLLGGSRPLYASDSAWLNLVADGMVIGGWVLCWFPLDTLLFTVRHEQLNRRIYEQLLAMSLTVRAAPVVAVPAMVDLHTGSR
jgi:hypothetical protein